MTNHLASCIKGNDGYGMVFEHPYWIDGWDILYEINMLHHGAEDMDGDCWVNFETSIGVWLSGAPESHIPHPRRLQEKFRKH